MQILRINQSIRVILRNKKPRENIVRFWRVCSKGANCLEVDLEYTMVGWMTIIEECLLWLRALLGKKAPILHSYAEYGSSLLDHGLYIYAEVQHEVGP